MKKITIFLFAAVLCFCLFSYAESMAAENEKKHPIDLELEKRLSTANTTFEMSEAFGWAAKEWDKLLNVNYKALMQKLSKKRQEQLRAAQREWVKYRDLEFTFNADYNSDYGGTIAGLNVIAFQCDFVRERALALGNYLKSYEEDLD